MKHVFRFFVLDEADGLLKQNYGDLIEKLHRQMPKITSDGKRLQMIVCSATLHAFEVKKMAVSYSDWDKVLAKNYVNKFFSNTTGKTDALPHLGWPERWRRSAGNRSSRGRSCGPIKRQIMAKFAQTHSDRRSS